MSWTRFALITATNFSKIDFILQLSLFFRYAKSGHKKAAYNKASQCSYINGPPQYGFPTLLGEDSVLKKFYTHLDGITLFIPCHEYVTRFEYLRTRKQAKTIELRGKNFKIIYNSIYGSEFSVKDQMKLPQRCYFSPKSNVQVFSYLENQGILHKGCFFNIRPRPSVK